MVTFLDNGAGYQIVGWLHVVFAVLAYGPLLLMPALLNSGETEVMQRLYRTMSLPALIAMGLIGSALAGMSDGIYKMSQTWLILSAVLWLLSLVVSLVMIRPAVTGRSTKHLNLGVTLTTAALIALLALMFLKPGG